MSLWTAIVVIIAMICATEVFKAKHRARHGITTDMMGNEKVITPPNNPALEPFDLRNQLSSNRTQGVPNMIALVKQHAARLAAA